MDWSLPKGKAHDSEATEAAALREVEEETGISCNLGPELATTEYQDSYGRPKTVNYWAMTPKEAYAADVLSPLPEAREEIDRAEWLSLAEARRRLSYDHDQPVLDAFEASQEAGLEVGGQEVHDGAEGKPERHQAG